MQTLRIHGFPVCDRMSEEPEGWNDREDRSEGGTNPIIELSSPGTNGRMHELTSLRSIA